MPHVHLRNGKFFPIVAGQSILDAAEAAGLALEHSCRSGRCGSCRTTVTAGRTVALRAEEGLTPDEARAGTVLSCARGAQTDLQLDLDDLGALAGIRRATVPCRIHALQLLAPDVLQVQLRLPPTAAWRHLAGQHVQVIAPGGLRRAYSLANASGPAGQPVLLLLHIRRVPGGAMSGYWFERARPGDLLRLDGPLGSFYLRDCAGRDLVLLATGTGYAPIAAMLQDLAERPAAAQPRSLQLLWGARQARDLYAAPRHPGLPGLQYTPVLSRAGADWTGARGHVQDLLLQQPHEWSRTQVYACGSPAMVQAARQRLLQAGLPAQYCFTDAFVASDSPAGAATAALPA